MNQILDARQRFYGKYRGLVTDNQDPDNLGRLRARVPKLLNDIETGWALPCVPYAGDGVGFYMIPAVNAAVWIEFEDGDISLPIWAGCFWSSSQLPENASPDVKIVKTVGHRLTLDDTSGEEKIELVHSGGTKVTIDSDGIVIEHSGGAKIAIDASSVTIDNNGPQITLDASSITIDNSGRTVELTSSSVTINGTSLEVM